MPAGVEFQVRAVVVPVYKRFVPVIAVPSCFGDYAVGCCTFTVFVKRVMLSVNTVEVVV